ncbi:M949_RS01915 family surface polysaccharide biosynthesis protein [Niastella populi]|uniref:Lipoprotein n=1 Tax=Niastella populi TaxID=550983 RepID=A0A1V9GBA9_9BACT|nr:hypothetical protein [Niastella populi]OQP67955.1 hypothetical protein A4R26_10670 [Niastella populi]
MKFQLLIIILLTSLLSCTASPNETTVPMLEFKSSMINKKLYKGQIKEGKRWKDNRGENIVILTQTGVYWASVYDATRGAKLFAYHFIKTTDNTFKEIWKISEVVDDCAFDVRCDFFSNSLTVTDLDADGIAEVGFALVKGCRLEKAPDEKKLVFYEGKDLYMITGTTSIVKGSQKLGGDKNMEKFDEAPDAFLEFANRQWNKYGVVKAAK